MCEESRTLFKDLLVNHNIDSVHRAAVITNLKYFPSKSHVNELVVSFKTYLNGFGKNWKDFTGFANMENLVFIENGESYNFGNIDFDSQSNKYNHILNFSSDFVSFNSFNSF